MISTVVQDLTQKIEEAIAAEEAALTEELEWAASVATMEAEMDRIEVETILAGIDGKNAEERKADLSRALAEHSDYTTARQLRHVHQIRVQECRIKAKKAGRLYHLYLAQLEALKVERWT